MTAATIEDTAVQDTAEAAEDEFVVTAPGLYDDIPDDVYHRDPVPGRSLSASGARKLLSPSCPAIFRHEQLHGRPPKKVFEFGSAAHQMVLGAGMPIKVVKAADWRTKKAQAEAKEIREAGGIPLLPHEYDQVLAMAAKLREHPLASAMFNPDRGKPEQSLFWRDQRTGVNRRARLDWLPDPGRRRLVVPDYKTTADASPDSIRKSVHQWGYHQQAPWYLDGVRALGLGDESAAFVFVFQAKEPPYLVTVVQLDDKAMHIGDQRNQRAIDAYLECSTADRWPGYCDDTDIETISLPPWVEAKYLEEQR